MIKVQITVSYIVEFITRLICTKMKKLFIIMNVIIIIIIIILKYCVFMQTTATPSDPES